MEQYIQRIAQGDRDALKALYEQHRHTIFACALAIVHDYYAAEDIATTVFLTIWEKAAQFRPDANGRAWVMAITRNASIDWLRKRGREQPQQWTEQQQMYSSQVEQPVEKMVTERIVMHEALTILPPLERQIVTMHIVGDLTFRTISELLHIPLGTIAWKYWSSLRKLQQQKKWFG